MAEDQRIEAAENAAEPDTDYVTAEEVAEEDDGFGEAASSGGSMFAGERGGGLFG